MNDSVTEMRPAAPASRPKRATTSAPAGAENVVDLLGQLTSQGAHLAQEQVALMQAEVREAATDIKQAIAAYAGAAVIGLTGLGVTATGLGFWLGDAIDNLPLGLIIVGVALLILAAVLYSSAKAKTASANLKPERSIRTVAHTPDVLTGTHPNTGGTHDRI
ncbi:phage holin family protein [Tsuneonella sp. HG249]